MKLIAWIKRLGHLLSLGFLTRPLTGTRRAAREFTTLDERLDHMQMQRTRRSTQNFDMFTIQLGAADAHAATNQLTDCR